MQCRRHPFDALDHAGGDRREQQLRRVEGIQTSIDVGVECNVGLFALRHAAMGVEPAGGYVVFEHGVTSLFSIWISDFAAIECVRAVTSPLSRQSCDEQ